MKNVILKFQDPFPVFMHISDIEGEFIPRKGDRVRYQVCPMPPRFDKPQGVHIQIIDFTPEVHKKWSEKETPEELKEDLEAMKEERELSEQLKGPGPLINTSGRCHFLFEDQIHGVNFCNFNPVSHKVI